MKTRKGILAVLLLALWLPSLMACASAPLTETRGQVLEQGTNKTIPQATVVALWYGTATHGIVESRTVCYHVESTQTDQQGRFYFPPNQKERKYQDGDHYITVYAYKAGYEEGTVEFKNEVVYLKPFTGKREERFEYLLRLSNLVSCYGAGNEKPLVPLYKALYEEAKETVRTDTRDDVLQTLRRRALHAWLRPSRELLKDEIDRAIENDPYLREHFK